MKTIAIIPARRGSKRLPGKNMALLAGKPLLQYAIESARNPPGWPKIFDTIVVTSDWDDCLDLARLLNVEAIRRPNELCADTSHDAEFVKHVLDYYPGHSLFAIIRPTSPFRTNATVERAMYRFRWELGLEMDSMRAVSPGGGHPYKTWVVSPDGNRMYPYSDVSVSLGQFTVPPFDLGTQMLGEVYHQNGCLHIARADNLTRFGNVSGEKIAPFFTIGYEGLDINSPDDLQYAEWLIHAGKIQTGGH